MIENLTNDNFAEKTAQGLTFTDLTERFPFSKLTLTKIRQLLKNSAL